MATNIDTNTNSTDAAPRKKPLSKRARYDHLKREIQKREQTNYSRLYLFHTGNDWYKMSGNSLLIFVYEIAPKIPIKPNILPDTDYTETIFDEGLISFHGLETLERRLRKVDVLKEIKKAENVAMFELNFAIPAKRMNELREVLKEEQEHAVSVLKPDIVLMPMIYTKMRHLMKRTYEVTRKMPIYARDVSGKKMMYFAKEIVNTYLLINKELMDQMQGWNEIALMAEKLQIEMAIAVELKILDQNSAVSIGGELIELKKMLKKEVRRRNATTTKTK